MAQNLHSEADNYAADKETACCHGARTFITRSLNLLVVAPCSALVHIFTAYL
jgi:hypothetical protein